MKNILGVRIETTAKYPGICRVCKVRVQVGEPIVYYLKTEAMEHLECFLDRSKIKQHDK